MSAYYMVRFLGPKGPEGFHVRMKKAAVRGDRGEFDRLQEILMHLEAAGEISGAEILLIGDETSIPMEELADQLEERFGAVERGRPDVTHVAERLDPETERTVRDLLAAAFEGGSNYWARIDSKTFPPGSKYEDFKKGGRMQPAGDYYHWSELVPTYPGGQLVIRETAEGEGATHVLDLAALKKAWMLLKQQYPKIAKRAEEGDYDAADGDAFLQLALFGEIVFG